MPLKLIPPRSPSPNWRVRGTYLGQYVDRTCGTPKRAVAVKVISRIQDEIERSEFARPGEPTFASAALAYVKAGRLKRKSPAREREAKVVLRKLVEHFGDTPLSKINQAAIDAAALALYRDGSPATRNRSVYTPVSAIMRNGGSQVNLRRPKGAGGKSATSWLWFEQAEALFEEAGKLNKEFEALLIVLCYTGLRLSEALRLTWNDVRLADGYAYVPDTKSSEPRAVFLPPVCVAALANVGLRGYSRVFRLRKNGHLYSLLRAAAARAGVDLPERSAFHLLRHTYATWMRRFGKLDTRGLVGTGAWKDEKSAARYAHVVVTEEAQRAALLPTPKARKG